MRLCKNKAKTCAKPNFLRCSSVLLLLLHRLVWKKHARIKKQCFSSSVIIALPTFKANKACNCCLHAAFQAIFFIGQTAILPSVLLSFDGEFRLDRLCSSYQQMLVLSSWKSTKTEQKRPLFPRTKTSWRPCPSTTSQTSTRPTTSWASTSKVTPTPFSLGSDPSPRIRQPGGLF